ncbi:MAG: hypothetical protein JKY96_00545 [Phycisphaerales bacterium]|nr:hypothetical protein [Phycisphaerales bacterium]
MQPRFQSFISATVLAAFAFGASTTLAQQADPAQEQLNKRIEELEHHLDMVPEDLADKVREEIENQGAGPNHRGINPFTREWDFQLPQTILFGAKFDLEGHMIVVSNAGALTIIEKYAVAANHIPELIWATGTALFNRPTAFELDLDGNIYVAGKTSTIPTQQAFVVRVSPDGFFNWQRAYDNPGANSGLVPEFLDIEIDPDGIPFLIMGLDSSLQVTPDRVFVYRLDPQSGAVGYLVDLEQTTSTQMSGTNGFIEMDRAGRLYALTGQADHSGTVLTRLDGGSGEVDWSMELDMSISFDLHADALEASPQGGVFLAGTNAGSEYGARVDEHGVVLWTFEADSSFGVLHYTNAVALQDGSVIFSGGLVGTDPGTPLNVGLLRKLDSDGNNVWNRIYFGSSQILPVSSFLSETITHMQVDRLGNTYAMMRRYTASFDTFYSVRKIDPNGQQIWEDTEPVPAGFFGISPRGLEVDAGGNVFAVGNRQASGTTELSIVKYSQPFLGVPTIQRTSATLSFEDQSIWAPGMGNLLAEQPLFTVNWNENFSVDATFFVPPIGDFGGDFTFLTDGTLNTGVKAELNGGTVDVHMPVDIQFGIPPQSKVLPGTPITIAVDWDPDPAARMTSCFTPTFNAGLTAGVDYGVFSSLEILAFSNVVAGPVFIDDQETIPQDYIPGVNLLDMLATAGSPVPGEWLSIESPDGIFSADFRTPQMFAQGLYDPNTNSFSTSADDRFFRFGVNITEALLKPFGLTAQAELDLDGGAFRIYGEAAALQLGARADIGATQDIDVGVVPMIRYDFIGENIPSQTLPITESLTFTVAKNDSSYDGLIEIIPTLLGTGQFNNKTDIGLIPGITWDTIEVSGGASGFGFDLISFGPECLFCYDWDLSEILAGLGVPIREPSISRFLYSMTAGISHSIRFNFHVSASWAPKKSSPMSKQPAVKN